VYNRKFPKDLIETEIRFQLSPTKTFTVGQDQNCVFVYANARKYPCKCSSDFQTHFLKLTTNCSEHIKSYTNCFINSVSKFSLLHFYTFDGSCSSSVSGCEKHNGVYFCCMYLWNVSPSVFV